MTTQQFTIDYQNIIVDYPNKNTERHFIDIQKDNHSLQQVIFFDINKDVSDHAFEELQIAIKDKDTNELLFNKNQNDITQGQLLKDFVYQVFKEYTAHHNPKKDTNDKTISIKFKENKNIDNSNLVFPNQSIVDEIITIEILLDILITEKYLKLHDLDDTLKIWLSNNKCLVLSKDSSNESIYKDILFCSYGNDIHLDDLERQANVELNNYHQISNNFTEKEFDNKALTKQAQQIFEELENNEQEELESFSKSEISKKIQLIENTINDLKNYLKI